MSNNSTIPHFSDDFSTSFQILIVSVEIIEWPILLLGVLGMFFGLEISHPVYSVLFCNLLTSFICSSLNIVMLLSVSYRTFANFAILANYACNVFHCCCWCVISILRYLILVKRNWTNNRYPDLR
jgi:hypothetical protein